MCKCSNKLLNPVTHYIGLYQITFYALFTVVYNYLLGFLSFAIVIFDFVSLMAVNICVRVCVCVFYLPSESHGSYMR